MENRLYEGWEIIKLLSLKKIPIGTKLRSNEGSRYKVVKNILGTLYLVTSSKPREIGNSALTNSDRRFYLAQD